MVKKRQPVCDGVSGMEKPDIATSDWNAKMQQIRASISNGDGTKGQVGEKNSPTVYFKWSPASISPFICPPLFSSPQIFGEIVSIWEERGEEAL